MAPAAAQDELNSCYSFQRPQEAIAACTRMIRSGDGGPNIFSARGVAFRWSGNYGAAIADFDEAIRRDPRYSIAYGQRGIAYRLMGNYQQAVADLETAVALDPNNLTAVQELRQLRSQGR